MLLRAPQLFMYYDQSLGDCSAVARRQRRGSPGAGHEQRTWGTGGNPATRHGQNGRNAAQGYRTEVPLIGLEQEWDFRGCWLCETINLR